MDGQDEPPSSHICKQQWSQSEHQCIFMYVLAGPAGILRPYFSRLADMY